MPLRSLTRAEVRDIDRRTINEYGLPGIALMENAGRNAAEIIAARFPAGEVVIACGKGNNAGDGFVIARHLELAGRAVRILLAGDPAGLAGDAATNFTVASRAGLAIERLAAASGEAWGERIAGAGVIIDALLGTGAVGPPRGGVAVAIDAINQTRRAGRDGSPAVIAIDLPSGLDCDSGEAPGACIRANLTISFVAAKRGFANPRAAEFTGEVVVAGIGAPACLLRELR